MVADDTCLTVCQGCAFLGTHCRMTGEPGFGLACEQADIPMSGA